MKWRKQFETSWVAYLHEAGLKRKDVIDREEDVFNGYRQGRIEGQREMLEKLRKVAERPNGCGFREFLSLPGMLDELEAGIGKEPSDE